MTKEEREVAIKKAQEQTKAVFEDGYANINERKYVFTVMTFSERRSVFAYMSSIKGRLAVEDFSFLDESKFKELEREVIFRRVTVDDMALSKKNIFEDHPEDYLLFITTALMVISYPFLKGMSGA